MHSPKDSLGSCRDFESPSLSLKSKIMARERHGAQPAEGGICLKTFKEAAQEAEISLHFWPPLIYFHKLAKVISLKQKRKKRKVYFAMSLLFLKCISGCHCSQDKIQNPLRGSRACLTRHPAPCCFSRPAWHLTTQPPLRADASSSMRTGPPVLSSQRDVWSGTQHACIIKAPGKLTGHQWDSLLRAGLSRDWEQPYSLKCPSHRNTKNAPSLPHACGDPLSGPRAQQLEIETPTAHFDKWLHSQLEECVCPKAAKRKSMVN